MKKVPDKPVLICCRSWDDLPNVVSESGTYDLSALEPNALATPKQVKIQRRCDVTLIGAANRVYKNLSLLLCGGNTLCLESVHIHNAGAVLHIRGEASFINARKRNSIHSTNSPTVSFETKKACAFFLPEQDGVSTLAVTNDLETSLA